MFQRKSTVRQPTWFSKLFGVHENLDFIYQDFKFEEPSSLIATKENRRFEIGRFSTPNLSELRNSVRLALNMSPDVKFAGASIPAPHRRIKVQHIAIPGVLEIHKSYPGALYQAASQFNCLEFPGPNFKPEDGITDYVTDRTQGPACAIACAAGSLFRNYFVQVPNAPSIGQSEQHQLNNLIDVETYLRNDAHGYWYVRNGYIFSSNDDALVALNRRIAEPKWDEKSRTIKEAIRKRIRIGLQEDVEVVVDDTYNPLRNFNAEKSGDSKESRLLVTQSYCSALSCAYSYTPINLWEPLARLVLDGAYESTILAGVLNSIKHREIQSSSAPEEMFHNIVFLTFVGGGAFGNDMSWIASAIGRAVARVETLLQLAAINNSDQPIELVVNLCHYREVSKSNMEAIDYYVNHFCDNLSTLED
jgi:hypothetical protein